MILIFYHSKDYLSIKNTYYGKYSKLNNLEVIVNNLDKKDLDPGMTELVDQIKENMNLIREEIMENRSSSLETLITSSLSTANE